MNTFRITELGFLPTPQFIPFPMPSPQFSSLSHTFDKRKVRIADVLISEILPTLMPSVGMDEKREIVRMCVQDAIRMSGVVPSATEVALYGSSKNNFGNDNAGML